MKRNLAQKKTNKLPIIVITILIATVLIIGAFFGASYIEESKKIGTDWGEKYYEYLKEAKVSGNKEKYGLYDGMKNVTIQFVEIVNQVPIMAMTYEKDQNTYVNLYKALTDTDVDLITCTQPSNIEFLYNIEKGTYTWYLHTETDGNNLYKSLIEAINNPDSILEAEYEITKGNDRTVQETIDGDDIILLKFDEIFIKPEANTGTKIEFSTDMTDDELRKNVKSGVEGYKTLSQILTKEIEDYIEVKLETLKDTKESIAKAREEVGIKNGIQVGDVILKYGKYVSDVSSMDSSMYGTLILKPNGKFHITANCEGDYPYKAIDCDGTYVVDKILDSFDYFDGLAFKTDTGVEFSLMAYSDGSLSDQWHGYTYVGEE